MPIAKTELIVLKRTRVQDSSLLLVCLSRDRGKISLVAKAATRPGSQMAEALQYFTITDVVFYENEKDTADYISKADSKEHYARIVKDELKYGYAAAAMEFANLFLPEKEANLHVYILLKRFLKLINDSQQKNFRRELLHFWYLLCIFSGYAPELEMCTECGAMIDGEKVMFSPELGGVLCDKCVRNRTVFPIDMSTVRALKLLAGTNISDSSKMVMSQAQLAQVRDLLAALTEYQIGKRVDLKSIEFLRKLRLFEADVPHS